VKLYSFDGIDASLDLVPVAARRALDLAGFKPSLEVWRALSLEARQAIVEAGSGQGVDIQRVEQALSARSAPRVGLFADPSAQQVTEEVRAAYGSERPISDAVWLGLSPLDRYALAKVAGRPKEERLAAAYQEIIGHSAVSTHVAPAGGARMVDISQKPASLRQAVAETRVSMSEEAFQRVESQSVPKGDVLGTARLAGIMAAKRTADLIPLCHPLALTKLLVELDLDHERCEITVRATVEAFDRTGVEMEALTAVSVAALTVYDMLKGIDRGMEIGPTRLLRKSGGRTGDFSR
jgi:cyclic pyranopterin monophosphate synthase